VDGRSLETPLEIVPIRSVLRSSTKYAYASDWLGVQVHADRGAFPSSGGSGTVQISTNRECAWSTKSDVAWLTVATPAEGQGDGTVGFTVAVAGGRV
jgi:hypothetical protein